MDSKSKDVSEQSALPTLLQQILELDGYDLTGFAALTKPLTMDFYQSWLEKNYHGEMQYLVTHLPSKELPQKQYPFAKSAIVVGMVYKPHPKPWKKKTALRIAEYAQGEDYHFWLKAKMCHTVSQLQKIFPDEEFLVATDSSPILERDLAARAGLGWFGKNTCLIHPKKGSLFLIGEILTSLQIETQIKPVHDFCGTCTKCLEICPTKALVAPHILDATKCISYLTIESRNVPALELRKPIADWFFGCDLCQTICPWNQKAFHHELEIKTARSLSTEDFQLLTAELRMILTASGKKIEKEFVGTPLKRAGPFGLRRNALLVIGNQKIHSLKKEVEAYLQDPRLGELAQWTLQQLKS